MAIIGAGRVGTAVALALAERGYAITAVISRTGADALRLAKLVKCRRASTDVADMPPSPDVVVIAVHDDQIGAVARRLAAAHPRGVRKSFVFHTSGLHTDALLAPVGKRGATVAAIHPAQTFPGRQSPAQLRHALKGIHFAITAEKNAQSQAELLVRNLGGRPVFVPAAVKPLYHAACVLSSSHLVVLLNAIGELSRIAGLAAPWTEVFGPLLTTAMANTLKLSAHDALTGPVVRGDLETLREHLDALAKFAPQFIPLYTVQTVEVARLARGGGRIGDDTYTAIVAMIRRQVRAFSPKPKRTK